VRGESFLAAAFRGDGDQRDDDTDISPGVGAVEVEGQLADVVA
jgi:hypothetical protein